MSAGCVAGGGLAWGLVVVWSGTERVCGADGGGGRGWVGGG